MSAACAAVAADEATKRLEARLSLYREPQEGSLTAHPQSKSKARRRAGFHVSSMEREASTLQADRMKLIEKDRLAARFGKRQPRRSMSYTGNIRQRSSIIGITLPEDAEASLDYEEVMRFQENPDIQKLTRNRIQRRVNSMPDPNAISRLSNSTVNQNVDFSLRSGSALSDTLEASSLLARALEPRLSLPQMQKQGQFKPFLAEFNQLPSLYASNFAATSDFNTASSNASIGSHGTYGSGQASFGSVNPFSTLPNAAAALQANSILAGLDAFQGNSLMAGMAPSHQAALQANSIFQNAASSLQQTLQQNPILAGVVSPQQNAAATLHANLHAVSLANQTELNLALQNLRMNATPVPESLPAVFNSSFSSSTFNEDNFDGKESSVISIPIALQSTDNYEVVMLLHEACKKDDSNVIRHVLQKFPLSARWTLSDEGVGNIALHIAAKHGNNSSAKLLLQLDSDCAIIRNNEGHVPLHIAVNQGHLAIVSTLCDTVPACARKQCENGNLPLHDAVSIASKHPDTPQIIQALLHAFKNAVFVTNDEGLLPIHLSSSSGFVGGLRTLLASEFTTIFKKDKLEGMLPIDVAAHQLQEYLNEDELDLQNDELDVDDQDDLTSDKDKSNIISCIEILLSSMSYNRLVPDPRAYGKEGKPFLPLHSVIDANPQLQTWKTLFAFYEEEHAADVDPLGRNAAHRICSRPIEAIENDIHILHNLNMDLFVSHDDFGFVPLHLALQNRDAPYDFVKAVSARHTSSLSQEVLPVTNNIYGNFLPVQIAAASGCHLDVLLFLIKSYPSSVSIQ
jgi:ankyrin repeat protein